MDNKIILFSTNVLQNLKSDLEFKDNLCYYHDSHKRRGFTTIQYYISNDIFYCSERVNNSYRNQVFEVRILLEENKKDIYLGQQGIKTLDNELKNTFNPSANLRYLLNVNNELPASLSRGRAYGGLDNFYNDYIMSQYCSMQLYDARILRIDNIYASLLYNYKNILEAYFANLRCSYSEGRRDYIFSVITDELGGGTNTIVDRNSNNSNHSLAGGLSHFFSNIKTVVKLNASVNWSISDYLLNGKTDYQRGRVQNGGLDILNSSSSIISGDFKKEYGRQKNIFPTSEQLAIYNNHYLNLVIYPSDKHSLTISNSLYANNMGGQHNQYFLDFTNRCRINKWKATIELNGQYLLNNNQFVQQFSTDIELRQSTFQLRPRQFIISTSFRL